MDYRQEQSTNKIEHIIQIIEQNREHKNNKTDYKYNRVEFNIDTNITT